LICGRLHGAAFAVRSGVLRDQFSTVSDIKDVKSYISSAGGFTQESLFMQEVLE
jgi:hypothetical protein